MKQKIKNLFCDFLEKILRLFEIIDIPKFHFHHFITHSSSVSLITFIILNLKCNLFDFQHFDPFWAITLSVFYSVSSAFEIILIFFSLHKIFYPNVKLYSPFSFRCDSCCFYISHCCLKVIFWHVDIVPILNFIFRHFFYQQMKSHWHFITYFHANIWQIEHFNTIFFKFTILVTMSVRPPVGLFARPTIHSSVRVRAPKRRVRLTSSFHHTD